MKVFIDGKWVDQHTARVSIFDHGFLYGDTVYETIRVYRKKPFLLINHLNRFKQSANALKMRMPVSRTNLIKIVETAINKNRTPEAIIRLTLSRGVGRRGLDPRSCKNPFLVITTESFKPYPPRFYTKGLTLAVVSVRRNSMKSLPPQIKSGNCLNGILAKLEANAVGADEALMLSQSNFLAEGSISNVFIIKKEIVSTPRIQDDILGGITRQFVCELVRRSPFKLKERKIVLRDLIHADEVFLTNSTLEIVPVKTLILKGQNKRVVRLPAKGFPKTHYLRALYSKIVDN